METGSTRVAAAIAVTVLALLAVFGAPMVAGQARSAQEGEAQLTVSRVATMVEACRVSASSYRDCDERAELPEDKSVHWGRGAGHAGVLADRSQDGTFTAYAVTGNSQRVYVWTSRDSRVSKHTCSHGSVARLDARGCGGPGW